MIKRTFLATLLLVFCLLSAQVPVSAYDVFKGACNQSGTNDAAACNTNATEDPISGSDGLLVHISNIVAFAAGAAAVIVILLSALKFITSGSDISTGSRTDTDVEDARRSLVNAIIGLVVIILARFIIYFVLERT